MHSVDPRLRVKDLGHGRGIGGQADQRLTALVGVLLSEQDDVIPAMRAGVATGQVVTRRGDVVVTAATGF